MANEFEPSESRVSPGMSGTNESATSSISTQQTSDLKERVADDLDAARGALKDSTDLAAERVKETITDQKDFAAHQVSGIASAMQKVGAELEQSDQPHVGRYAREIGGSVESFAKSLEGKDLGQVATMAEDFGRKQPLAFLGVAALAGLAASRFLTASSQRTQTGRTMTTSSPNTTPSFNNGGADNG